MKEDLTWIPPTVDMTRPNAARMYDYFLGGYHNFEVDRQAAEAALKVMPRIRALAQANRAYVQRVVDFMMDEGMRQFLDIGAGIPTVGHIHHRADARGLPVHVIYVDRDPIAIAHAEMLLADVEKAAAIQADARQPQQILDHPETQRLIDFCQPVGLLCISVLPFITNDGEVFELLHQFYERLAPGSYVCLSHSSVEYSSDEMWRVVEMYKNSSDPAFPRHTAVIDSFFDGLELVEPGMTLAPLWRSGATMEALAELGGIADYTGVARVPAKRE